MACNWLIMRSSAAVWVWSPTKLKHRHAKRARVIFLVIGVFVELFTVMVRLSFFGLRCTARRKLEIYNL